jgi:hypothetical protein
MYTILPKKQHQRLGHKNAVIGKFQVEVAANPTFEALHRTGDATCPRSRFIGQVPKT